jgi:hypothetical protein
LFAAVVLFVIKIFISKYSKSNNRGTKKFQLLMTSNGLTIEQVKIDEPSQQEMVEQEQLKQSSFFGMFLDGKQMKQKL